MYYALVFYPQLDTCLAESINAIRREYDPTVDFIRPHITVVFPIPASAGEAGLINHIRLVLCDCVPFEIRLDGFYRSPDHWLLLTLAEGVATFKQLYRSLYTGILDEYRRDDIEYVPHIGLGLFLTEGSKYDWDNPQAAEFVQARYEAALQQAKALPLKNRFVVDKLRLVRMPSEVLEWATGQRATIPADAKLLDVREFLLGEG